MIDDTLSALTKEIIEEPKRIISKKIFAFMFLNIS